MNATTTPKVLSAQFSQAVEDFRLCRQECLVMDFPPSMLGNLEDTLRYGQELVLLGKDLVSLTAGPTSERFQSLKKLCREGWTSTLFCGLMDDFENNDRVVVLVYEGDELMGALTEKDLDF
jgi:hypothetical protein